MDFLEHAIKELDIKHFRDSHKLSLRELSEKLDDVFSFSYIAKMEKNQKPITQNFVSLLVQVFGKESVKKSMYISGIGDINDESISSSIPYWNLPVSAGKSIIDIIGSTKPDGYIKGLPGADIAENILPVSGASMEPEVSNGAIIGVRKIDNWETLNTERIYLIITQDDRMIKRIEHDSTNEEILWCISPNYPKFKIYKSDIIEIQRVCFVYNPK